MVRVSGVPYEVEFSSIENLAAYDRGFEDGCRYEREAILAIAEINGMTPDDIARCIRARGSND